MCDWRLLLATERSESLKELHFLDAPQVDVASVRIGDKLLTVWTEVYELDALANFKFTQVPKVDRPNVIIRARVFLSVGEVNGHLSFTDQGKVAKWRHVP